jgi:bifunctional DNA-binding transcriptional regulator/antitoxin component of YhaV-PrlF toxin-antitoxin module
VNGVSGKPIKIVVLGEDGRVTLPREIRKALKIEVGEKVLWTLEEDRAYLKKVSG